MVLASTSRVSGEIHFWQWFAEHEARLYAVESGHEKIVSELAIAMRRVHPDLSFEFSPVRSDHTREFVISANGIRSAFPVVETVIAAAPSLPRWNWIKFRPRREPMDLTIKGHHFKVAEVRYMLFKDDDPDRLGVMIFLPGYSVGERERYSMAGFLLLDNALGEFDTETRIGVVEITSPLSEHYDHSRPWSELVAHFDEYFGTG